MDYKLNLNRFIWYHLMDGGVAIKNTDQELTTKYQELIDEGTKGKLELER